MAEPANVIDTTDTDAPALAAARAADAKGGDRTVVLRVGEVLGITELFVVTSAGNSRLVRALVDEFDGDEAGIRADVEAFIARLQDEGFLIRG